MRPQLQVHDNQIWATSLQLAKGFDKRHADVLRAIENSLPFLSEEFIRRNIASVSNVDQHKQQSKVYELTRDGFSVIALAFTGEKGIRFREAYVTRFSEMEAWLRRKQYKQRLTSGMSVTDEVKSSLGMVRGTMTVAMANNLMIARGLHIPPISRKELIDLVRKGVIDGYKDHRKRQWIVYQDSFARWLDQRRRE